MNFRTDKIPSHKIDMELNPFYKEIVNEAYERPIMIAMWKGSFKNKKYTHSKTSITNKLSFDILSIKAVDICSSAEYSLQVNISEYLILQEELDDLHNGLACRHFEPADPIWWVENFTKVLKIIFRPRKKLYLYIDKNSIKSLTINGLRNDEKKKMENINSKSVINEIYNNNMDKQIDNNYNIDRQYHIKSNNHHQKKIKNDYLTPSKYFVPTQSNLYC